ncbi:MAG: leucine-rich repeat domain-containing protein [Lyngbya sp. HA4199-MV5]|jgi:internalin A|nr:leucine-rich repeat domain-containing protein [Lyngbya sp. HA4199-MV5]
MPETARSFLASPEGVERLNAAKQRLNLSIAAIAERATVSADTVRRLWHPERGKRVSRANVVAIAHALNLLPEDIVPKGEWQYDDPQAEAERRIQEALQTNATALDLSRLGLIRVPEAIDQLVHLTELSLFQNQLTSVPATLSNLSQLTKLYLYQNQLTSVPATLGNLSNLTVLRLDQNQLTSVPATLSNLSNLTVLSLSQNQLTSVPATLSNLSNLTVLSLSQNQLTSVPATLGSLSNLMGLSLSQNQLTRVPETLGNLSNLTQLYLTQNQLTRVPETLGNLSNLTQLYLNQNQLTRVPETLSSLLNLTQLSLSHNQLTSLPEALGNLFNLTALYLDQNQLTSVPKALGNLSNLTKLYLDRNQLMRVPETLGNLSHLTMLSLDRNQLTTVPGWIARLTQLERIDLNDNALTALPAFLRELPHLTALLLHGNKALGLSDEILGPTDQEVNEGAMPASPQAILDYYFRIQAERQPLNEAKLILVGYGNVGKTSLVNRLLHHTFDPDSKETEGIQITPWHLRLHDTEDITLHVWDFGGQEIMHSTHQFFLTERSLYLLVLNGRQGHEDTDAEYWLELIQSFGGNSPVLVVLNKVQEHPFDVNRSALRQKFPNIRAFIATDCEANLGLDQLRANLEHETDQLEHLRDPFPASWVAIKQRLTDMQENYISFEQFRHVCQQDGETNHSAQDSLAIHLHSLGIALNYKDDPRLRDTHVLNPHWVTRGIYQLLNAHTLADTKGDLAIACLAQILDQTAYPPERHGFLLELMRKFELCVRFPEEEGRYLIPDLLDKQQPPIAEDFDAAECLNFRYEYPILPEGLLPRFIVRTHVLSMPQDRWRTGAILTLEGNRALVKADRADRCITISIKGTLNSRRRLLAVIRYDFDRIHSSFKFKPQEKVPVPGQPAVSVDYNELLMREERGQTTFDLFTGNGLLTVNVRELLNGVDLDGIRKPTRLPDKEKRALRLFYSYSHKDELLRDELEVHLKLLQRYGLIQNWHDRRIMPGADWQQELDTNLEQADIILLLISPDFINSDYCFQKEMTRALERHKAEAAIVVPILIRPVNWDSFHAGLGISIQALPLDLNPVTRWSDKDEAWLNVEQGIQRLIEEKMGLSMRELGRDRPSLADFSYSSREVG